MDPGSSTERADLDVDELRKRLELWPGSVESVVVTEPEPHMFAQLRKRVGRSRRSARAVQAPGEQLPFDDGSFDTVAHARPLYRA